jgi:imidazolonepropionase-like amidohydrolase
VSSRFERIALALCALLPLGCLEPAPPPLAIVGATLWDGSGAPVVPDARVVILEGRIACAGDASACPLPDGVEVLDARGLWLLPGFIDTHVHLTWSARRGVAQRAQEQRLACGITTVREASTGDELRANLRARDEAASPRSPVPRLVVAGRVAPRRVEAHGQKDLTGLVRHLAQRGVDAIKVKALPPGSYADVIREAHALGLPVWGHTGHYELGVSSTQEALRAGIDGVAHLDDIALGIADGPERAAFLAHLGSEGMRIDPILLWSGASREREDELIALFLEREAWLEPTLASIHLALEPERRAAFARSHVLAADLVEERGAPVPPGDAAAVSAGLARMRDFVRRLHAAGGTVVAGSDGPFAPGVELHEEIALLVEAGLPPAEALAAATRNAARALRLEGRIGTIEAGRDADLVLLDADPLADVRATRRVHAVVKEGVVYALPSPPCALPWPR